MSAQKTGKNGPSLPVPAGGRGRAGGRRSLGQRRRVEGERFWRGGSRPGPGRAEARGPADTQRTPLQRRKRRRPASHPSSPTQSRSRFRRRRRRAPASPTSSLATTKIPWISGSSIWPGPILFSSPDEGSADIAPNETGDLTGVASYDQGEWSVIFKRPIRPTSGAAFLPGQFLPIAFSVWDGFSRERGNRRGLTVWNSIYVEPQVVPSAVGPMVKTALLILAIELAVIGWVRWRYGSRAARGARRSADAPCTYESMSRRELSGENNVQEHLRSRR